MNDEQELNDSETCCLDNEPNCLGDETPLGEHIDGGNDHVADDCHEAFHSQFDDDPNPYHGTFSED